jgi:hypothetical protein
MSNLLLYLSDIIVRILEVDLFYGDYLLGIIMDGLVDGAKAARAELLKEGILASRVVMR